MKLVQRQFFDVGRAVYHIKKAVHKHNESGPGGHGLMDRRGLGRFDTVCRILRIFVHRRVKWF
jgi:hypothetical protein